MGQTTGLGDSFTLAECIDRTALRVGLHIFSQRIVYWTLRDKYYYLSTEIQNSGDNTTKRNSSSLLCN